jgi:Skp family chaperone for outer membrane proteins
MLKKAKKAIEEVAKENSIKQVLDTSSGLVLYYDSSEDIMALVKKKLGIAEAAAAPEKAAPSAPKK